MRILIAAALALAAAAPLGAVPADLSGGFPAQGFDETLFRTLNSKASNGFFDALMPVLTDFGRWKIILALGWAALLVFGKRRGRAAAIMLVPLIAASDQLSSSVIKPLAARLRPCEVIGEVHLWLKGSGWVVTPAEVTRSYKSSFSFPSSHAANITAAALFLGLAYKRWLFPLLIVAAAVSYSRVYTGVHWPTDILAGMAIGSLLAAAARLVQKRISWMN